MKVFNQNHQSSVYHHKSHGKALSLSQQVRSVLKTLVRYTIVMLLLVSCHNEPYEGDIISTTNPIEIDEEPSNPTENIPNDFFAKLNGEEFVDDQIFTVVDIPPTGEGTLIISGAKTVYHQIILYLPRYITEGIYYFDHETILDVPNLNVTYSNTEDVLESGIGEGTLTINEHNITNSFITGTFECVVNSQSGSEHLITEGSFMITY